MDTITYRFEGRNHYVLTAIDLNIRAKPLITKHTKYTARALLEIIENVERLRAKALAHLQTITLKFPSQSFQIMAVSFIKNLKL